MKYVKEELCNKGRQVYCLIFYDSVLPRCTLRLIVVLNSHEAVKEAFLRRPDDFSHRPPEFDRVMQLHDGKRSNYTLPERLPEVSRVCAMS